MVFPVHSALCAHAHMCTQSPRGKCRGTSLISQASWNDVIFLSCLVETGISWSKFMAQSQVESQNRAERRTYHSCSYHLQMRWRQMAHAPSYQACNGAEYPSLLGGPPDNALLNAQASTKHVISKGQPKRSRQSRKQTAEWAPPKTSSLISHPAPHRLGMPMCGPRCPTTSWGASTC